MDIVEAGMHLLSVISNSPASKLANPSLVENLLSIKNPQQFLSRCFELTRDKNFLELKKLVNNDTTLIPREKFINTGSITIRHGLSEERLKKAEGYEITDYATLDGDAREYISQCLQDKQPIVLKAPQGLNRKFSSQLCHLANTGKKIEILMPAGAKVSTMLLFYTGVIEKEQFSKGTRKRETDGLPEELKKLIHFLKKSGKKYSILNRMGEITLFCDRWNATCKPGDSLPIMRGLRGPVTDDGPMEAKDAIRLINELDKQEALRKAKEKAQLEEGFKEWAKDNPGCTIRDYEYWLSCEEFWDGEG